MWLVGIVLDTAVIDAVLESKLFLSIVMHSCFICAKQLCNVQLENYRT